MANISRSPDRNTFQKEKYLERKAEEGRTPENDDDVRAMAEYYESWNIEEDKKEADPKWAENNLEYDLRSTNWILEKARSSDSYAQNIYAALCNNDFQNLDVVPILTEKTWSCSWRYAGGIVAHMKGEGDYIDWYCSGIRDRDPPTDEEEQKWSEEQKVKWETIYSKYVPEGMITEEIREDFKRLGWVPAPGGDWEHFETDNP